MKPAKKIVIGIDQSYKRTGITVIKDKEVTGMEYLSGVKISHASFRKQLRERLSELLQEFILNEVEEVIVIFERIRLLSGGKLSQIYIQATGALCGSIIEAAEDFNVPVYSVDARAWKSAIVGTSKPKENRYGIPPEKYPTILYLKKNTNLFKNIIEPYNGRATKGIITVVENGKRYRARVIDDIADSYCIAMYGFLPEGKQKLKLEKF